MLIQTSAMGNSHVTDARRIITHVSSGRGRPPRLKFILEGKNALFDIPISVVCIWMLPSLESPIL